MYLLYYTIILVCTLKKKLAVKQYAMLRQQQPHTSRAYCISSLHHSHLI